MYGVFIQPMGQSEDATSIAERRRMSTFQTAMKAVLPFLHDPLVLDILLNADGAIWIDRAGEGMSRTAATMSSEQAETALKLVAALVGEEFNPQHPLLETELDLSDLGRLRVEAALPPISEAPVFAIRKPAALVFSLDDYVHRSILSADQAAKLTAAVKSRANILVGGGTGTGKTTFANALLRVIAETGDRVYIVEDTKELQCEAPNHIRLRVRQGVATWQQLIAAAMRFRPTRIVVGEVRDASALDLIDAWNTGHPGGLATVHANNTSAMLDRLCQLTERVVLRAPKASIAEAINVLVHLERAPNHPAGRVVTAIDRVDGLASDGSWRLSPL